MSASTSGPVQRPTKFLDAVLFGFFVYDGFPVPGIPVVIPVSDFAAIILVALAIFRRPVRQLGSAAWFVPLFIVLLVYLAFGSMYNDVDWTRRAFRLAVMVVLVVLIVTGRINISSGLKGLAVALVINAWLFYLGRAPDNYGGFLTGYLGDKNVAGLYYSLVPLMVMLAVHQRKYQIIIVSFGAIAVFLTGSRTALAAYAFALLWIILSRRLGALARVLLFFLFFIGLLYIESNFAQAWIFSSREGSDLLRERIEQAAVEKSASSPWFGLGLGESHVFIGAHKWFFHDSYLALYVEGGWILLTVIVGIYVRVGFRRFFDVRKSESVLLVEGAIIVLLVCAYKLGEVFLSLPGFILIACALLTNASASSLQTERKHLAGVHADRRYSSKKAVL